MTTAENIALIGESDSEQFRPMCARAVAQSISEEHDEYEGYGMSDYTFADGSVLRICAGHMEAIK